MSKIFIMPCLDIQNGSVVKGVKFVDIVKCGDPVECAVAYQQQGADELAMLDISASIEGRPTMLEWVKKVAQSISIPLTVGGGIAGAADAKAVLDAGAQRICVGSAAVKRPEVLEEIAAAVGKDRVMLALDAAKGSCPCGYNAYIGGGKIDTGIDALELAKKAAPFICGIVLTSVDTDGAKQGYDIALTRIIADNVPVPVIASGGAGCLEHFAEAVTEGHAQGLLAASLFHFKEIEITELKKFLIANGIEVWL